LQRGRKPAISTEALPPDDAPTEWLGLRNPPGVRNQVSLGSKLPTHL